MMTNEQIERLLSILDSIDDAIRDLTAEVEAHNDLIKEVTFVTSTSDFGDKRALRVDNTT
jgi:hypothetical protein